MWRAASRWRCSCARARRRPVSRSAPSSSTWSAVSAAIGRAPGSPSGETATTAARKPWRGARRMASTISSACPAIARCTASHTTSPTTSRCAAPRLARTGCGASPPSPTPPGPGTANAGSIVAIETPLDPSSRVGRGLPKRRPPRRLGRPPRPQRRDRRHRRRFLSPKGGRATPEGTQHRAPPPVKPCTAFLQRSGWCAANRLTNRSRSTCNTAAEPRESPNPSLQGHHPPTTSNRGRYPISALLSDRQQAGSSYIVPYDRCAIVLRSLRSRC